MKTLFSWIGKVIWFLIKLPFLIVFGILKLLFKGFGDDIRSAKIKYRN